MKLRWWHVALGILVGLALGRWTSPSGSSADGKSATKREGERFSKYTERQRAASPQSRTARFRQEIRDAPSDSIPGLTYRALETADNQERALLGLEALSKIDEANWQEVLAQFSKITHETGRTHDFLSLQALTTIGKNVGLPALEEWRRRGLATVQFESKQALYGWATQDPEGARAWLDDVGKTEPEQRLRLLPMLLGAMALTDTGKANEMLASLPAEERSRCVGDYTWNLVQNSGVDSAVDWMLGIRQTAGDKDDPYAKQVTREVMGKIFSTIGDGSHADAEEVANVVAGRLERIQASGALEDGSMLNYFSQVRGTMGLNLMDRISNGKILSEEQSAALLQVSVQRAVESSPAQSVKWFAEHTTSPAHGSAALIACQRFSAKGDFASARAIMDTVNDAGIRSQIAAAIGK